jgi:transcriptional regulator with XRE-family HTH domain
METINNEPIAIIVGRRVRAARKEKGYTIEGLANEANIEYSQLSRIELGKINTTLTQIHNIAIALGIKLSDLLNEL